MSFDALTNRGEYLSAHYLDEVLPGTLRKGLLTRWAEAEKNDLPTPRTGLRALRRGYFERKIELTGRPDDETHRKILGELHGEILTALGFAPDRTTISVARAGSEHEVAVAYRGVGVMAIECGWATESDAAADPDGAGVLLTPLALEGRERIDYGMKLAGFLFATEEPPRYVLILNGAVITLADRLTWGEGRYLAVSLDVAFGRNDARPAGELDVVAALFGADSLQPPPEGGDELLARLVDGSRRHAVGVNAELREGLRLSVEIIANEVLDRIRQAGVGPEEIDDAKALAARLKQESLRYLYRILFLLFAEARPELGVLPVDNPEYADGYSMSRLGDLVARPLTGEAARAGFHLYESLDLLFGKVNDGHRPHRADERVDKRTSEDVSIRFEALRSNLFLPEAITLIGRDRLEHPRDDTGASTIDTRLRNQTLHRVLRLLMLTKGKKKERGGFISYAQLGIPQLGAVYEGLMSYTGFIAEEELYEVAKGGDDKDGSWLAPAATVEAYDDESVFVHREDDVTGVRTRVRHPAGSFVYRLAGRDRATSASYYTPESLTQVTVELALKERLDQDGTVTPAREMLDWTICEPALGSGSFLNEAINQVAAEYLRRRQSELGVSLDPEQYTLELQKAKAYIALHNCYGVDLNDTAVELAEVSVWLNVMHRGLQAPWFGLHLRRGNSLIGAGRRTYSRDDLNKSAWLHTTPTDRPLAAGALPTGAIHHFLLPASGWGSVASFKEAKALEPDQAARLAKWRRTMGRAPKRDGRTARTNQVLRLQALARRTEWLWDLVGHRLALSEAAVRRPIDVWGAQDLPDASQAQDRQQILDDLRQPGTPYWRLKTVMDVWCALWFWPLRDVDVLLGDSDDYETPTAPALDPKRPALEPPLTSNPSAVPAEYITEQLFGEKPDEQLTLSPKHRLAADPGDSASRTQPAGPILRGRIALKDLGDWISFAEAVLGTNDIPPDSLVDDFATLAELDEYERSLAPWMGMREPHQIDVEFPWFLRATQIATDQAFFHWEIEFAQVFARGGFDLQVGNPPWVRPEWKEAPILAEHDPWFGLAEHPDERDWSSRRAGLLEAMAPRNYLLDEAVATAGTVSFFSSVATYPLLVGTQPDLYRAFMQRVWRNLSPVGTAGLLHPDTHLTGGRERALRQAAYRHLRVHADFVNAGNRFFPPPVDRNTHFGLHIYGHQREVNFRHVSWLFDPRTLTDSLSAAADRDHSNIGIGCGSSGVTCPGPSW